MPFKDPQAQLAYLRRYRRGHPEISQRWRDRHAEQNRVLQLENTARRRYGLTREQHVELRKRPCEICGAKAKKMCVDHVVAGSYRGVLCQQCNTRLGWFESRRREITAYLQRGVVHAS